MLLLAVVVIALASSTAGAEEANIAPAAEITCHPQVAEGRVQHILDGRVGTGFAFEVGTSGDGSVAFDFASAREVTGLRFFQHSEIYYTTRYVIEGDADGDGDYELTLAEEADAAVGEWLEHRWDPVSLRVLRLRSVEGVSEGKRAHPCVAEIEVLGPALAGDAARAAELGNPVSTVSAPRPLRRMTPLVVDAHPPVVVAGRTEACRTAAQTLAEGLSDAVGRDVTVVDDPAEAGLGERTVLAVGNCVTNPLIARLFHNWYAFADSLYPGPRGYTLRTVCDPSPSLTASRSTGSRRPC
ncbi:MAG: hypothetical protein U9R79_02520 [Armatimonadota bacterium]|nr:hypothetical protein [Armatimonadota bacterium]